MSKVKFKSLFTKFFHAFAFLSFEIIFCGAFSLLLILYGPFLKLKDIYVTSAMTTLNHKYLATAFLSENEIKSIMDKNKIQSIEQNTGDIEVNNDLESNSDFSGLKNKKGVELINLSTSRYKGYILVIDDPSKISVGLSDKIGEQGATLEDIIKNEGALGGINAGGFSDKNMKGHGGEPTGVIVKDGKIIFNDNSKKFSFIGFDSSNKLILDYNMTLDSIKEKNIRDGISFFPFLIINGQPMITSGDGGWGVAPRSAIAQRKDGKVLFLCIDGRRADSIGASLKDCQDILLKYGAYNAANLDGGSSSTLIYDSKLINKPSDILGQRLIPTAFIIK